MTVFISRNDRSYRADQIDVLVHDISDPRLEENDNVQMIEAQFDDQDIELITDLVRNGHFASPSLVLAQGLELLRTEIDENGFTFVPMGEQD